MTRKYKAVIIETGGDEDDIAILQVGDASIKCFVNYCPILIEVGKSYETEFEMVLPDELMVMPVENEKKQIEVLGKGLSCNIFGFLDDGILRSAIEFGDQDIHYDYPYLNKQYIQITAHRIDVSFLREIEGERCV
ncbi:hypothetical protein [Pseudomonas sp. TWP3-2]|uniref:hypothetical protein n=1 Tax=Pseudomonas sp. TWP3-2 TaxID=2804574 RepID=UPI003CE7EAFD